MDIVEQAGDWFWWATGLSMVALVATLIGVPWVVARLPSDYFSSERRTVWRRESRRPIVALIVGVAKNVLGGILLVVGIVMLLTPGQGLMMMIVGLLLLNFPGKYRVERWLVLRPGVLRTLNWLRRRHDQPPFETPPP